jgi:hypothetical protein
LSNSLYRIRQSLCLPDAFRSSIWHGDMKLMDDFISISFFVALIASAFLLVCLCDQLAST